MLIVADDKIPYLKGILEAYAKIEYYNGSQISKKIVKNADAIIIRTRTICNKELLEGSKVKFIATATIGFDHIDTKFCKSNNIEWTNVPGCNSGSVMQYIASALGRLSLKYNFDLSEKTIGIIGHGNVGSKVAKLASILGMKVLLNDPPLQKINNSKKYVSLKEIQEKADIISFHVPLNKTGIDKTWHLVDENFLKKLKSSCIIINSSRGSVIDNFALKIALQKKQIKGAVIDVWETEPDIDTELLDLVDFATPHIAGYSADGKAKGTAMSVQAISNYFGFNLKNWFPKTIPTLQNTEIKIDDNENDDNKVLIKCILASYDILFDDERLRKSINTFEKQRGEYPIRREFSSYSVKIHSSKISIIKKLHELEFNIEPKN